MFDLLWSHPTISVDQAYLCIVLHVDQAHCPTVQFYPRKHLGCKNESLFSFSTAIAAAVHVARSTFLSFSNLCVYFLLPCRQTRIGTFSQASKSGKRQIFFMFGIVTSFCGIWILDELLVHINDFRMTLCFVLEG